MNLDMDFVRAADQIALRMRELQLSNTELAQRAGVDRSRVTMLLKGEPWSMRPNVIAKLERALELKVGAIGALGAGKSLKSQTAEPADSTDLAARVDELELAVEEQRRMLEAIVGRRGDPGRGVRR